jgi:hypothetical protein
MLLPFVMLLAQAAPAAAPANCAAVRVAMPASLAGWGETASAPTVGKAFLVTGANPATVRGLSASEAAKPGNAALVPFEVDADATYRVALSAKAWVDVVASTMAELRRRVAAWPGLDDAERELDARPVADALYHAVAGALLLAEGQALLRERRSAR